jgi:hypothetical protein
MSSESRPFFFIDRARQQVRLQSQRTRQARTASLKLVYQPELLRACFAMHSAKSRIRPESFGAGFQQSRLPERI